MKRRRRPPSTSHTLDQPHPRPAAAHYQPHPGPAIPSTSHTGGRPPSPPPPSFLPLRPSPAPARLPRPPSMRQPDWPSQPPALSELKRAMSRATAAKPKVSISGASADSAVASSPPLHLELSEWILTQALRRKWPSLMGFDVVTILQEGRGQPSSFMGPSPPMGLTNHGGHEALELLCARCGGLII